MSLRDDMYDEYDEEIERNYSLEIGDVVLIQNPGHGFVKRDVGKYVEVTGYGDYFGEPGVTVREYDKPIETIDYGNDEGVVGYGTFGKSPMIPFNVNDEQVVEKVVESALDKQVSGTHYKGCKIQPIEYIHANGLDYFQGNVVKYVTRHKDKNGKGDIEKAIHIS